MSFGLTNAPATFQAYINKALVGLVDVFCVVYLDDILIYSSFLKEHQHHVKQILKMLRRYKLYANLKKCAFHTDQVEFLEFIVSTKRVSMDPRRVETIKEWPVFKSYREVQIFLGFANFYRRFIEGYSKVAAPLTGLLEGSKDGKKSDPFEWPDAAEEAFNNLCAVFTQASILTHFNSNLKPRVETDASIVRLAGIYSQLQKDQLWHPVAFWSRKLTPTETRYETHDQELLAIVEAFKHWRHYLESSQYLIEVLTDHNNLRDFMNVKQLNDRQAR